MSGILKSLCVRIAGVLLLLGAPFCAAAEGPANGQIVILVGLDGFRWDYLEKFKPATLSRLAAGGVRAEKMVPSFPSLTFPNFYTIATGLRPEHHGIIGNNMFDPRTGESFSLGSKAVGDGHWWEGEPIWVTAQKQGMRAACMFRPGSEAEICGMRPWQWKPFDHDVSPEARVTTVLQWMALPAAERPRLVTLYFHEADSAGHRFGPDAPETAAAVDQCDKAIAQLVEGIHKLDLDEAVNLVIVSDHGMAEVSPDRTIILSDLVKPAGVQVDFSGAVAGLRPPPELVGEVYAALAAKHDHFQVYRREEVPERLHFRDHPRIPPIVLMADEGWTIVKRPLLGDVARAAFLRATHGFDPALPSMGATFIGSGPSFKHGATIPPFDNVEIYSLLCKILGLKPAANDGENRLADAVLASGR